MAVSVFEIPLTPGSQYFYVTLLNVQYRMTLTWRPNAEAGYTLDIADAQGNMILAGIPLVTGADLTAQYRHLGLPSLACSTDSDPDAPPTYANIGGASHLYFVAKS